MAYGLERQMFIENGPTALASDAAAARRSSRRIGWRRLDTDHRFAAVETALRSAANDVIDRSPVAL
jgi:hypothetical protein